MKRILSVTLALIFCISSLSFFTVASNGMTFSDLNKEAWYYDPVHKLYQLGGVNGYTDGTFKPNASIKTNEFITLLMASNGERQSPSEEHWFLNYFFRATELGIIDYPDPFDLDTKITRLEMAKIVTYFLELDPIESETPIFTDASDAKEDVAYIDTMYRHGIIKGYEVGYKRYFRPLSLLSRAEACTIIINVFDYRTDLYGFKEGISASSRLLDKQTLYAFQTPIPKKNAYLGIIEPISALASSETIRLGLYLKFDKIGENEYRLRSVDFEKQVDEILDILAQKFSPNDLIEIRSLLYKKQNDLDTIPSQTFTSSMNNQYEANIESAKGSYFIMVTLSKPE